MTVVMNGDLLWHNTLVVRRARRTRGVAGAGRLRLRAAAVGMKPVVASADLAICHEEVPLAPAGGPYRNYPLFSAPPQVVASHQGDRLRRLHNCVQPQLSIKGFAGDTADPR